MEQLADLFKLVELTRSQPQYGYALSGIKQDELSNLAEHHYLVTFIAWQLALRVKAKGAKVDAQKVIEYALIHDLGELFGGDIAMPYANANPKARRLAKSFELENQKFLSKFFGSQKKFYRQLSKEIMDAKSDEALIAKLADYMEVTHYKLYVKVFSKFDIELVKGKLHKNVSKIRDGIARNELQKIINDWLIDMPKKSLADILY